MDQVLGAFDRRALEFEAMVRGFERQMSRDRALRKAREAFTIEMEDAKELLTRAQELLGHSC